MLAASLNHTWYSTEHFAAMIHEQRMSGASDRPMTGKEATARPKDRPWVARQSVNLDAIVCWLIWNAEKLIQEAADFTEGNTAFIPLVH